ncbi:fibrinogen-like protein A [Anopheles ziemanni]|uniref:fibrinogen-like protein A n=1 Tax=Anopheles ziemanni TaxID=345580 RepID=UPI00265ECF3C|nr:fibrinogen-like protein A [Anopheles ziemanni]
MDSTLKEVQLGTKETDRTVKELDKSTKAKEVSLQEVARIVKSTDADSRTRLEELENKLVAKMNSSYQHTLQAAIQHLQNEPNKITDLQSEFIRNQSKMVQVTAYSSCRSAPKVSGTYDIQLAPGQFVKVYCEQVAIGGGWITFQHRFNGAVDFFRNWSEYRDGFGDPTGEFWLGLKYLHKLTSTRRHELLVEVKDYEGNYGYARYNDFSIESEAEGFKLKFGNYSGTAGDSLAIHNGMKFTTKDRDNDNTSSYQCANATHGAWWYKDCSRSNLNGPYRNITHSWKSLHWHHLKNDRRSMAFTKMMLREIGPLGGIEGVRRDDPVAE